MINLKIVPTLNLKAPKKMEVTVLNIQQLVQITKTNSSSRTLKQLRELFQTKMLSNRAN